MGIFVIALSETEGETRSATKTICEVYKTKFKTLFIEGAYEDTTEDEEPSIVTPIEEEDINETNNWSEWAGNIKNSVRSLLLDLPDGDRDNAHYPPKFSDYLLKDLKLIPL